MLLVGGVGEGTFSSSLETLFGPKAALAILRSSISPSSPSTLSEVVPSLPAPLDLWDASVSGLSFADSRILTHFNRLPGWKSGAFGFRILLASPSGRGVVGLADAERVPLTVALSGVA